MVLGAHAHLLTNILLMGIEEIPRDAESNHAKIGTKLVVAIAVDAAAEIAAARAQRRGLAAPPRRRSRAMRDCRRKDAPKRRTANA